MHSFLNHQSYPAKKLRNHKSRFICKLLARIKDATFDPSVKNRKELIIEKGTAFSDAVPFYVFQSRIHDESSS